MHGKQSGKLCERMAVDGLNAVSEDEGSVSDCQCFGLDLNHDGKVFC